MSIDNVKLREAGRLVELEEAGWQQCNNICAKHVEENSSFSALWAEKRVGHTAMGAANRPPRRLPGSPLELLLDKAAAVLAGHS